MTTERYTPNPDAVEAATKVLALDRDPAGPSEKELGLQAVQAAEPHIRKAVLAEVREKLLSDQFGIVLEDLMIELDRSPSSAASDKVLALFLDAAFPEEGEDG